MCYVRLGVSHCPVPTVPVEWSDSHKLGDLLTICLTELRKLRHEDVCGRRSYTWN